MRRGGESASLLTSKIGLLLGAAADEPTGLTAQSPVTGWPARGAMAAGTGLRGFSAMRGASTGGIPQLSAAFTEKYADDLAHLTTP